MKNFGNWSQVCVLLLIIIAATVAVMLMAGVPAWWVIIIYWVTLTVKNICDWMAIRQQSRS